MAKIVFAYNVDSGLINLFKDYLIKIVTPDNYGCRLCQLTHDTLGERDEWTKFIKKMDNGDLVFLHKDEFLKAFPEVHSELPAIFRIAGKNMTILANHTEINTSKTLTNLIRLIKVKLSEEYTKVS